MVENYDDLFTLDDFDLDGKTVLLRVDINSPIDPSTGRILDDHRMKSHLKTIKELKNTKLIIIAHQSRPGKNDYTSLEPHAKRLGKLLRRKVDYVDGLFDSHVKNKIKNLNIGDVLLLENARFYAEETYLKGIEDWKKQENTHIVKNLSPLIDFFVHDAFAAAHRAQPTLVGFTNIVPCIAGRVMESELENMGRAFEEDMSPKVALLGGMKVDDSIEVAEHMLEDDNMDKILTAGVTANIFMMAAGYDLGEGNEEFLENEIPGYEKQVEKAKDLLDRYDDKIKIPKDVVLNVDGKRKGVRLMDLRPSEYPIFDIGLDTIMDYSKDINKSKLVILNGPAGAFEMEEFSLGTTELFKTIAHSKAFTIIGGGHSTAVLDSLDIEEEIDHVSTGGGSCINFLAGRPLVGVEALRKSYRKFKDSMID